MLLGRSYEEGVRWAVHVARMINFTENISGKT